jgi:hypothetical protein
MSARHERNTQAANHRTRSTGQSSGATPDEDGEDGSDRVDGGGRDLRVVQRDNQKTSRTPAGSAVGILGSTACGSATARNAAVSSNDTDSASGVDDKVATEGHGCRHYRQA